MKNSKKLVDVDLEDIQRRGRVRKLFVLAAMVPVGVIALGGVHASTSTFSISANTTLTANHAGNIVITANDVTLDCDGYTVSGSGSGIGIYVVGVTGVTVKNCTVENFGSGIYLEGASGNTIKDNTATGITSGGNGGFVAYNGSDGNIFANNLAIDNSGRGFLLHSSCENTLTENVAINNRFRGFDSTVNSNGNTFEENTATDNGSAGFVVSGGSTGNELFENTVSYSRYEGYAIFSSGNLLEENMANNNGTYGYRDSTGPSNTYIDNKCSDNGTAGSLPAGLCTGS